MIKLVWLTQDSRSTFQRFPVCFCVLKSMFLKVKFNIIAHKSQPGIVVTRKVAVYEMSVYLCILFVHVATVY